MPVPHQRLIVAGVWSLFVGDGIWQGLSVPKFMPFGPPDRPLLWFLPVIGLFLGPFLAVLNYFALRHRTFQPTGVGRWIDSRWGHNSTFDLVRAFRPVMLLGSSAFALGAVGFWMSIRAGASVSSFDVSLFFLAAGIGLAIASILLRRWLPRFRMRADLWA